MDSVDRELARMLARSTIGGDLKAVERAFRRLITEEIFEDLDGRQRRRLDELATTAGGRALYAFVLPWIEALRQFADENPHVALQDDDRPARTIPPRAGSWIRDQQDPAGERTARWHLFTGDIRLRFVGRRSYTLAETRCGRLIPTSDPDGRPVPRVDGRPRLDSCRTCRGIGARGGPRMRVG